MRLFIAILFNDAITSALTELQENMKKEGVRGSYTTTENLHLTLAFIGEYGNPDAVLDAMEKAGFTPFSISLNGVGSFGKLFWAGISENRELRAYVKRLRRALAEEGIPFDRKQFSPHITLIRNAVYKNDQKIPVRVPPVGEMKAANISLMKSERGRNGMIYTEIGSIGEDNG